jgi:transcriptional regulator with XRE-family HTH domain
MKTSEFKESRLPVFTERFQSLRNEGETQVAFAARLDIARPTVAQYENGSRIPDAEMLKKIAEKCGVSANWLLGLSDFLTENERKKANDLYDRLMELMPFEFDENDIERVYRCLSTIICGFKDAMCDYYSYTWYENAAQQVALALSTVSGCMSVALQLKDSEISIRRDMLTKLDEIIKEASMVAYAEMGYCFTAYRDAIVECLGCGDYRAVSFDFAYKLDGLKEMLEEGGLNFAEHHEADE